MIKKGIQGLKAYTQQKLHINILDSYDISWVLGGTVQERISIKRNMLDMLSELGCWDVRNHILQWIQIPSC